MAYFVDEDCFILANSAEPDEMPPCVPFHEVLHYLPKYMHLVSRIQNKKGSRNVSMKILLLLISKFYLLDHQSDQSQHMGIWYCELPVSFSLGNDVDSCSSGRYSLYVLSVINSNYIELIFHLFT